jgi:hypothetical protein
MNKEWRYQERADVKGGQWEDVGWFDNLDDALQCWATTYKEGIEARLLELEITETELFRQ